ncbi:MAG: DUF3078 domain-containing protein [Bacteroidaceae bacterium]|nr:DUF3078 domain-containing protein [Bacteroidaceae bacterium]
MRKIFIILALCGIALQTEAKSRHHQKAAGHKPDASIVTAYSDSLTQLVNHIQHLSTPSTPSPYLFRLFAPGTVYTSALAQSMGTTEDPGDDAQLQLDAAINEQLNSAYILYPQLFTGTEQQLIDAGRLRTDLPQPAAQPVLLAVQTEEIILPDVDVEAVEPEVKKPNFWTFKGNGSLQFTQSYYSKNWYQGGETNYAMLSQLSAEANYNNQRRVQWDNKFEAQLGFQTSETDEYHKFKATNNLLRLTSSLGIKAIGHWNYAAQLQLETQPYKNYKANSDEITAAFLSPLYVRSSIGMDYIIKKKRFEGKLHLAPLSYVITYVSRDELIERYGINEGHHSKHEWGPNIEFTFTYHMWKNISWASRLYWFSNFHLTRIEWENTLNFTINKYLSAKLFLYPRFDDSSDKYRAGEDHDGTFLMFKEWLSLGLNYDF